MRICDCAGCCISDERPPWRPPGARQLLQDSITVTPVTTTRELLTAVSEGAQHIQITAHLDLTTAPVGVLPLDAFPDFDPENYYKYPVYVNASRTNTVTVRTAAIPSYAAL